MKTGLLVKRGISRLNTAPRPGIREMLVQANVNGEIDPERISWVLAPRLNTAGRLEHAKSSYRLLTTESPDEAREIAVWLEQKEPGTAELTVSACAKARKKILTEAPASLLFIEDSEFSCRYQRTRR